MSGKHTPGPWVAVTPEEVEDDCGVISGRTHDFSGDVVVRLPNGTRGAANARLIAAAPDLLEALKQRLPSCQCLYGIERGDVDGEEFFDQNACPECINDAAVIAKAEGVS